MRPPSRTRRSMAAFGRGRAWSLWGKETRSGLAGLINAPALRRPKVLAARGGVGCVNSIRPKWPLESERDSRVVLKVRLGVRSIGRPRSYADRPSEGARP